MVNFQYWKWEGVIAKEYCNEILNSIKNDDYKQANIGDKKTIVDINVRRTDVFWENPLSPVGCILQSYITAANNQAGWEYPITGMEKIQISRYKSENKGFYDWHVDLSPPANGIQRKISAVLLLNDPSEFEGGVLQFKGSEDEKVLEKQGSIVVFPSFIEHKVTPVTSGTRYTAVGWASGPSFR